MNKEISDLTAATTPDGTEVIPVDQGANTVKMTLNQIKSFVIPPLIYRATISQTIGNAPVVTVLENALGAIIWACSLISQGQYTGMLSGAFPDARKVHLYIQSNPLNNGNAEIVWTDTGTVTIYTSDRNCQPIDGILVNASIQILVYA
jgi:hypothetical protein